MAEQEQKQETQEMTPAQETEAIKAMKEAFAVQIAALKKQLDDEKKEHAKQIKDLILGRTEEPAPITKEELEEREANRDPVKEAADAIVAKIKKQRGIK